MTAPDKIWINLDAPWDGMVNDRHGTNGFPCYHHQRTVDELLEALGNMLADGFPETPSSISARALIAKHRKGG